MAYNVPVITDVFLRPIRKNAKHFYGRKKMWRSEVWEWRSHDLAERNPTFAIPFHSFDTFAGSLHPSNADVSPVISSNSRHSNKTCANRSFTAPLFVDMNAANLAIVRLFYHIFLVLYSFLLFVMCNFNFSDNHVRRNAFF
jgi:hypothetical protein